MIRKEFQGKTEEEIEDFQEKELDAFIDRLVDKKRNNVYDPVTDTLYTDSDEAADHFQELQDEEFQEWRSIRDKEYNIKHNVEKFRRIHKIILTFLQTNGITKNSNIDLYINIRNVKQLKNNKISMMETIYSNIGDSQLISFAKVKIDTTEIKNQITSIVQEMEKGVLGMGGCFQKQGELSLDFNMTIKDIFEENPEIYFK